MTEPWGSPWVPSDRDETCAAPLNYAARQTAWARLGGVTQQHKTDILAPDRRQLIAALRTAMAVAAGDKPFILSSGATSYVKFNSAEAVCDRNLGSFVLRYFIDHVPIEFDAIGGPALGAAPLAYGAAPMVGANAFLVRKEEKSHGEGGWLHGRFVPGDRVLAVEDVISTGASLLKAMRLIQDEGGLIVAAATLIDRTDGIAERIAEEFGVPYFPMTTYADFGIESVAVDQAPGRSKTGLSSPHQAHLLPKRGTSTST